MPYYTFLNPKTSETKDIFFHMNDKKVYVENGVEWVRVFLPLNSCIDGKLNPLSSKDFVEKTRNKKGTLGDLFDLSKEASLKREQLTGKDEVRDAYYKNYQKTRKNRVEHPDVRKSRLKQELSKNFDVEI